MERVFIYFFSLDWEPGGFILACVKGEAAQGPFVSAAPSLCLCLYVWMPLRQDVKVCGWERASSGMNGFTF